MDKKTVVPTLLTGGIFLISFLSLLLLSFNAMLSPIRKDISRLDTDIKATRQELKVIGDKLDQLILVVAKIEHKTQ